MNVELEGTRSGVGDSEAQHHCELEHGHDGRRIEGVFASEQDESAAPCPLGATSCPDSERNLTPRPLTIKGHLSYALSNTTRSNTWVVSPNMLGSSSLQGLLWLVVLCLARLWLGCPAPWAALSRRRTLVPAARMLCIPSKECLAVVWTVTRTVLASFAGAVLGSTSLVDAFDSQVLAVRPHYHLGTKTDAKARGSAADRSDHSQTHHIFPLTRRNYGSTISTFPQHRTRRLATASQDDLEGRPLPRQSPVARVSSSRDALHFLHPFSFIFGRSWQ